jgi:hypothetical protein
MMRRSALVVILVSCLGSGLACGGDGADRRDEGEGEEAPPDPDADGQPVDGSRLTARSAVFPGTSPAHLGWHDGELDVDCEFDLAADGEYRCLPGLDALVGRGEFSSPDCAASSELGSVFNSLACGQKPSYAAFGDGCPARWQILQLGPVFRGDTIYRLQGGECVADVPDEAMTYYELGEEVEPTRFVAAERSLEGEGRVQRHVLAAQDGAREPSYSFRDAELDEDCGFAVAADGSMRCIPGDTYVDGRLHADADCSQQLAWASGCSQSAFGFSLDESLCEARWQVYPLGEPVTGIDVYQSVDGECLAGDLGDEPARPVGEEIPPSTLAPAELEERGDGRIRSRWARLPDGSAVFHSWWDTEYDMRCMRRPLASGEMVCMPDPYTPVEDFEYYADEACTERTSVVTGDVPCAQQDELALRITDTCPGIELFHVAGPVEGELYTFDDDTGACRPITEAERDSMRALGEPVDTGTFERATTP